MPRQILAHSAIQGLDEFSGGLVHPLATPAHLLVLVAVGCWAAQRRPFDPRGSLLSFAGAAAAGLAVASQGFVAQVPVAFLLLVSSAAAAFLASGREAPAQVRLILTAAAGLLLGLDSAADGAASRLAALKTMAGTWAGLNICFLCVAYYTSLLPDRKWASYAVRIAASWMIAIAIMMLAFAWRRR